MRGTSLRRLMDENPPTQAEIDAALSVRYSDKDREKAAAQALAAGFDALLEPEPVIKEQSVEPPSQKQPAKWPIDFPVVRFGLSDVQGWGLWLVGELTMAWPSVSAPQFAGMIRGWTGSNEHHFIRTSNSAALAISVPHPLFGGETVVRGIFCWSRFPDEKGAELHLVQLYRHTIDWARSRRALRFENFERSDLSGGRADFFIAPRKMTMRYVETR